MQISFFCPSPLLFGRSTVLSFTRGPAGSRTTTGSLSATQECRDTNCTTTFKPRGKQKNMTKKGLFFGPQNVRKSRRKWTSPVQASTRISCWSNQLQLANKRFNRFATMKGPKLDPAGVTTFYSRGSTF